VLLRGLVVVLALAFVPVATATTLPAGFAEVQVVSGIDAPTSMAFAPDGRLFVAEQSGGLRVVKDGALLAAPFVTVPVDGNGERGILGVAFDPAFATNKYVYVYYTATTPNTHNRVSRFTAAGDVATGPEQVLRVMLRIHEELNHQSLCQQDGGAHASAQSHHQQPWRDQLNNRGQIGRECRRQQWHAILRLE
jgi:hypothetical protein